MVTWGKPYVGRPHQATNTSQPTSHTLAQSAPVPLLCTLKITTLRFPWAGTPQQKNGDTDDQTFNEMGIMVELSNRNRAGMIRTWYHEWFPKSNRRYCAWERSWELTKSPTMPNTTWEQRGSSVCADVGVRAREQRRKGTMRTQEVRD